MTSTISFARGAPSTDIVDVAGLSEAATEAFAADPAGMVGYGTSLGYLPLRQWLAQRHGVAVDQVLITNGSMQADAFLFDQVVGEGTDVVVERPTYDRTLLRLTGSGARVHQVTLQADGIDVAELKSLLASGVRPRLAHIIPNYHNPGGVTLSLAKRHELLALAAEYGFTIFEDDPYVEIRFRGEPLPSMLSLDQHGSVVHASSFTKTVCPGVRVGYLVAPAETIAAIAAAATQTYISPGMVAQAIVYHFCVSGRWERSIETVRTALARRSALLADELRKQLPEAKFQEPDGGYFLWIDLPGDVPADRLVAACADRGVAVVKGSDFLLSGGDTSLRLAYSAVTEDQIPEGVERLAAAVHEVRR
ncbi:PLP-dependent aminotransferase family protein [Natronosporangium hydrolyticum]|uniref:PLP-dependent aminotransferase family protein n=1 Tax=Natronosporangium hydrolyticum TaxID=2811111 RepID=A0A895YAG9_9ACTN|nr:PLP-dependent aminotransferase family protein [Natronosporangium hydrolyticum]QSB14774.1 PLP-dependent aminotransferase family protein [Natronosporangium hydrolyticum]